MALSREEQWTQHQQLLHVLEGKSHFQMQQRAQAREEAHRASSSTSSDGDAIGGILLLGLFAMALIWVLLPFVTGGACGWFANKKTAGKGLKVRIAATLLASLGTFGAVNAWQGNPWLDFSAEPAAEEYVQPGQ